MTQENQANLLRTYRMAIEAGQDGIADSLEDIILDEMKGYATPFHTSTFGSLSETQYLSRDNQKVICDETSMKGAIS